MFKIAQGILLALCVGSASAQGWTRGISDDGEYHFAATTNDSDGLLGQFCYPGEGSCLWLLLIKTRCETDVSTPILASTSKEAFNLNLICHGPYTIGGVPYYRYILDDFSMVDRAIRTGGMVGFAMPLESGRFRVVRFGADGATLVIDRMRAEAGNAGGRRPKKTKDEVL